MKLISVIILAAALIACVESKNAPHLCSHVMKNENHAVCSLFPEAVEGPYFLDDQAVRQNITEGKPGIPLELSLTVVNFTTCEPLANVAVDIWQCDAAGEYSSFIGVTFPDAKDDNTFLRGIQYTDSNGMVTFYTIFPGWYPGRTVHIHVDAHVNGEKHIGQLYFTETLTAYVERQEPYVNSTTYRVKNSEDGIFNESDGVATTLNLDTINGGFQSSILMGFQK